MQFHILQREKIERQIVTHSLHEVKLNNGSEQEVKPNA